MPHTVRRPVWAKNPAASAQNVRNDGAVNNGRKDTSSPISEAGSDTVRARRNGGALHARLLVQGPCSPPHACAGWDPKTFRLAPNIIPPAPHPPPGPAPPLKN